MVSKLSFLVGLGAGYVLGARSGRERYDQIAGKAQELWRDPRVQEKAGQAGQAAMAKVDEASQAVKEKVADKVSNDSEPSDRTDSSIHSPAGVASSPGSGATTGTGGA